MTDNDFVESNQRPVCKTTQKDDGGWSGWRNASGTTKSDRIDHAPLNQADADMLHAWRSQTTRVDWTHGRRHDRDDQVPDVDWHIVLWSMRIPLVYHISTLGSYY